MIGQHRLVLFCGLLCTVTGAALIWVQDKDNGLLWYGVPVMVLGMALVGLAVKKPKTTGPAG